MSDASTDVAAIIALIDRLEGVLARSGLAEIELEVGGRTVILRSPAAVAPATAVGSHGPTLDATLPAASDEATEDVAPSSSAHAVVAPLTGIFYHSPSPGADPYVNAGDHVSTGQVIGLIEAMKLFNEIKSDVTGTVRRHVAGDGELVKAKGTLIEVDPA